MRTNLLGVVGETYKERNADRVDVVVHGGEGYGAKIPLPPLGDLGAVQASAQGVQQHGDIGEVLSHPTQQPAVEEGEDQDADLEGETLHSSYIIRKIWLFYQLHIVRRDVLVHCPSTWTPDNSYKIRVSI